MGRLLTLGLFFFGLLGSQSLLAKTWVVEQSGSIKSIQQALSMAQDGDLIIIKKGIYRETDLRVDKSVRLKGEDFPIIDGQTKHQIMIVAADDVSIEGLQFSNSGSSGFLDISALQIVKANNVQITNNRFNDNFFAIHALETSNLKVSGNHLSSGSRKGMKSANGIHCWKGSNILIENNTITGHRDGIYLEFINHSLIRNNKSIKNKRYGLHFMFSNDNTFSNNRISANGAGVAVMYSKRVTMTRNVFSENWGNAAYGILLKEINDSDIEGNLFQQNTIAIFAESTNRIELRHNEFLQNGWALQMQSSATYVNITQNNFIANTFDVSSNGNLPTNSFDGNYWDKYEGYDLNRDGYGDIPHRPISFYSVMIARNPGTLMLFRSFFVKLMDKAESALPSLTPVDVSDRQPKIKKIHFTQQQGIL